MRDIFPLVIATLPSRPSSALHPVRSPFPTAHLPHLNRLAPLLFAYRVERGSLVDRLPRRSVQRRVGEPVANAFLLGRAQRAHGAEGVAQRASRRLEAARRGPKCRDAEHVDGADVQVT